MTLFWIFNTQKKKQFCPIRPHLKFWVVFRDTKITICKKCISKIEIVPQEIFKNLKYTSQLTKSIPVSVFLNAFAAETAVGTQHLRGRWEMRAPAEAESLHLAPLNLNAAFPHWFLNLCWSIYRQDVTVNLVWDHEWHKRQKKNDFFSLK